MHDIQNEGDIKILIDTFYGKVRKDNTIGFIFNELIGDNWDHHLPQMYKFWNMVLLSQPGYVGSPTKKHVEVDRKIPLQPQHFERWLSLWNDTVDSLFHGEIALQAKEKAKLMANLISIKVEDGRKEGFIQ